MKITVSVFVLLLILITPINYLSAGKVYNLYNRDECTDYRYVNWITGELMDSDIYCASSYIPISPNQRYTLSKCDHYAWYDYEKVFISGTTVGSNVPITLVSPSTAAYLRLSVQMIDKQTYMVVRGASLPQKDIDDELMKSQKEFSSYDWGDSSFDTYAGYYRFPNPISLPRDDRGRVVVEYMDGNRRFNPVSAAQYIISRWSDPNDKQDVIQQANFLIEWCFEGETCGLCPYLFDWPGHKLIAPWYSAMAQGQAASALVRVFLITKDTFFLKYAERLIDILFKTESLLIKTENGVGCRNTLELPAKC